MAGDLAHRDQRVFAFGPFLLVPERQLLTRGDVPVRIGGRALDILIALVERPGQLVSKAELFSRVWPNTFVEESNLKVNVAALRRALGEKSGGERYIIAVSGRGYKFVSSVRASGGESRRVDTHPQTMRPHNLPMSRNRTIGRADTVDAILRILDTARLATIVGPGGIGKTRVALTVADRLTPKYEHGVWFVDLGLLDDPKLVPASIAAAIGLTVHSADIEVALAAFLRDREVTLVLDNCEHVIDAVAACAEMLLAASARSRLLATSREPLRASGEQVYRLPPLKAPPQSVEVSAADAMAFSAVELFVERAAGTLGEFVLNDDDAPVVAEICRRLDGLALAIELTAARVDAFDIRQLLLLLDEKFQLLKDQHTGPKRQRTLTATLDWSYDLLTEPERTVLRRLSVFTGVFSLESACAVAIDEACDRAECIAGIANLVAKSLVSVERGEAETHYRLLDTTRKYAGLKLAEKGELENFRNRHARHFLEMAERAEAEWKSLPTAEWLAAYGRKIDDLRSALSWTFAGNRDIRAGVALTVAAIPFWEHLSLIEECRTGIARALKDDFAEFRSDRDNIKLYTALGTTLLHTTGPHAGVRAAWTSALELAEALDDTEYELRCLWGLCDYHTWTGDHRVALATANRIRHVATKRDDSAARNNVDRQTGTALRYLGDLVGARHHLERMISGYTPPVARSDVARFQLDPRSAARGTLANVLWLQGYPDQAVAMARRQLEDARAARHAVALSNALIHTTCPIALFVEDLSFAESLLANIDSHVAEHAMTIWRAMGACLRGEWLLKRRDMSGLGILRSALDELFDAGFRMRYPWHLGAYAAGLGESGDIDSAHAAIDRAMALATSSGEVWCMSELLRIKGNLVLLGSGGKPKSARELFIQALDWARRQGALSLELRAATSLAMFEHQGRESEQGAKLLASIYGRFDEGFGTVDLLRARSFLKGSNLDLARQ